jgi:hypothetical protein
MNSDLERRIAENESAFRQINEGIDRGQWPGDEKTKAAFVCECARLGCTALVELLPTAYREIRTHPRRFVLAPGHEASGAETVVERNRDYVVVEKRGEAGRVAEAKSPR